MSSGSDDAGLLVFLLIVMAPLVIILALAYIYWEDRGYRRRREAIYDGLDESRENYIREARKRDRERPAIDLEAIANFNLFELEEEAEAKEEDKVEDETTKVDGKSFEQMTPDEFEDAVCRLFNAFGYNLSVTQRSRDGGIDLDGLQGGLGQARVVVQCKRYSSPVGVSAVRELFGVVSDDPEIAEGFLVTTSTFTQDAQAFAQWKRITLIDGDELEMHFSKITGSDPSSTLPQTR